MSSLGRITAKGLSWMGLSLLTSKLSSFIAQIILASVLVKNDFAIYAIAISISTLMASFKNGGVQQIIIQRGNEYRSLANVFLIVSQLFNVTIMFILIMLSDSLASYYQIAELKWLIIILAISFPLSSPVMILKSKLLINSEFKIVSALDSLSSIIRNLLMVIFAILGFGVFSFVVPTIIVLVLDTILYWIYAKPWPSSVMHNTKEKTWSIIKSSRWAIIGSIAVALSHSGDYLVVSLISTKEILAIYFFGFSLTMSISGLLSNSIISVMTPILSKVNADRNYQSRIYKKSMGLISLFSSPFVILLIIIAPICDYVWQEKWHDAIPVIQFLSISLLASIHMYLARSLLEARGFWKLRAVLLWIESIGILLFAVMGALLGDASTIALSVVVFKLCFDIGQTLFIGGLAQIRHREILVRMFFPLMIASLCGVASVTFINVLDVSQNQLFDMLACVGSYILLLIIFYWYLFKDQLSYFIAKVL